MIVNATSIAQKAIQIKNEIITNANTSVKSIILAKKILAGILTHVFVRRVGT